MENEHDGDPGERVAGDTPADIDILARPREPITEAELMIGYAFGCAVGGDRNPAPALARARVEAEEAMLDAAALLRGRSSAFNAESEDSPVVTFLCSISLLCDEIDQREQMLREAVALLRDRTTVVGIADYEVVAFLNKPDVLAVGRKK